LCPVQIIQAGDGTLRSDIREVISFIPSKEEMPEQWRVTIITPIYKNSYKTESMN
jgi:hypothetical protein